MQKKLVLLSVLTFAMLGYLYFPLKAATGDSLQGWEYASIRWSGREFTHVIRPNGDVEMLGPLLQNISRQQRVDERTLCMTIAVNALAREGYEVAAMTNDQIIMKRAKGH